MPRKKKREKINIRFDWRRRSGSIKLSNPGIVSIIIVLLILAATCWICWIIRR